MSNTLETETTSDLLAKMEDAVWQMEWTGERIGEARVLLRSWEEWLTPLLARLRDCEMSLAIYDTGQCSEYWLRYPMRSTVNETGTNDRDSNGDTYTADSADAEHGAK